MLKPLTYKQTCYHKTTNIHNLNLKFSKRTGSNIYTLVIYLIVNDACYWIQRLYEPSANNNGVQFATRGEFPSSIIKGLEISFGRKENYGDES